MRNLVSTNRSNQCVQLVKSFHGLKKCNKAGYSAFLGLNGPFFRCRVCTSALARQCDDVYLDGKLIS